MDIIDFFVNYEIKVNEGKALKLKLDSYKFNKNDYEKN